MIASGSHHSRGPDLLELVADHFPADPTSPAPSLVAEGHPTGVVQRVHREVDLQLLVGKGLTRFRHLNFFLAHSSKRAQYCR